MERAEVAKVVDRLSQKYEDFVPNLFHRGYTHVGYGEDHGEPRLHRSVRNLIPVLRNTVGLQTVCLELEDINQGDINNYLLTGNETDLQRVIEREKVMVQSGYPCEGRIATSDYFDIIREARKNGSGTSCGSIEWVVNN